MSELFKYSFKGKKAKKDRLTHLIIFGLVLFSTSFLFYEELYEICNMIGSIVSGTSKQALVEFSRTFPYIMFVTYLIYSNIKYHVTYLSSKDVRMKNYKTLSIVSYVFDTIIIVYTVIGYFLDYHDLIETGPTYFYPFDLFVCGILVFIQGLYFSKKAKNGDNLGDTNTSNKKLFRRYMTYFYLVALGGIAGVFYSFNVLDYSHGNVFFNIMFTLMYLMPVIMLVVYKYIYCELKDEYKAKYCLTYGIVFMIINLIIFIVYLLIVRQNPQVLVQNCFGLLPIDYTASVNAFLLIYGITNLLTPIIVIIKGIKLSK